MQLSHPLVAQHGTHQELYQSTIIWDQITRGLIHSSEANFLPVVMEPQGWLTKYRGASKSLARPGRKQVNVSVSMACISFGALPCRKRNLMSGRVRILLKSRASLTCFRACFVPGRAKDLSALRYKIACSWILSNISFRFFYYVRIRMSDVRPELV